jgi:hypothetical protein
MEVGTLWRMNPGAAARCFIRKACQCLEYFVPSSFRTTVEAILVVFAVPHSRRDFAVPLVTMVAWVDQACSRIV